METHLGVPTFFVALSCEDLRRKEFLEIMQKLNETDFDHIMIVAIF